VRVERAKVKAKERVAARVVARANAEGDVNER
jgi:hypothetical protein